MALITKEWIASDAVDASKINIGQDTYLKGRNVADDGDVSIVKVDSSDNVLFASVPYVSADPTADNQLTRKSYVTAQLGSYQLTSAKNAVSGYCGLDGSGKVAAAQLPSYVDDVLEYADLASFPGTGETGKIYVALDTNKTYRWSGSAYVEISVGEVASVNTKTGVVTLVTDDIGEDGSPVNLWFTDARAKAAAVADSITDAVTDVAPSQNAVFDALAGKSNTGHGHVAADISDFATAAKTAAVLNTTAGTETDQAASVSSMKSYVTTQIGAITGADAELEVFTLIAGDITNGYVDLAQVALADSILVWPIGGPIQTPTTDYTLSYTGGAGGKTRVTFAGDLASTLIATHKLAVKYLRG